ncbi:MAG: outer membrane protein assembly factor BamE [Rhodospirillales bacterium]
MPVAQHPPSSRRYRKVATDPLSARNGVRPCRWQPASWVGKAEAAGNACHRRLAAVLAPLALGLALAACEGKIATHGDPIDAVEFARVQPGISTRADVVTALGTPSSVATFDDNVWYYLSNREQTIAFMAPESIERQVVTVRFDNQGVVSSIEKFGLERSREVDVVSRETPSFGQSPSIIQQMMGNLGRFNKESSPGNPTGGGGGGGGM